MNTKKGFTLIELLITVGLFAIIITIAVGGFTNAIRTQRQVSALISAQSNVSLALEQMARQVRTGYLFCSTYGNNNGAVAGNTPSGAVPGCDCVLSTANPGWWTCDSLIFYDAESEPIQYSLQNGELMEAVNGGTAQSVTGNAVSVKYLEFNLFGQTEGDNWTPRVVVSLGIAPSSSDPAISSDVFNLQTTISARNIDCYTPPNGSTQC